MCTFERGTILILSVLLFLFVPFFATAAIDSAANGPVYGDPQGVQRVEALEALLKVLRVKVEHPRIILTPELISRAQSRMPTHPSWSSILQSAQSGNILDSAFVYLILKDTDPTLAQSYVKGVYSTIMAESATIWSEEQNKGYLPELDRKIAGWAIAFDWAFNGLSESERSDIIGKIGRFANIEGRAAWIRRGEKQQGETFHREEWIFWSWRAWPEIALSGHYTDADFCYKARWDYDWYLGDAARTYAYLADGTPLEGYQYGVGGLGWFMALHSATGINLLDDPRWPYAKEAASYQLYGTDFGLSRNVFHSGVGLGAGGLLSYLDPKGDNVNWKTIEYHSRATQFVADSDPYQQWISKNLLKFDRNGSTSWIFSNEYYGKWNEFENISTLLFYDIDATGKDPQSATYDELPYGKLFSGGNEVYMRSGWGGDAAMAAFRVRPAFTKTAHGDFDANTFILYRKGNLAPDSGVYDHVWGQTNYFKYQKNTIAHNNILVIDPSKPDAPTKLSSSAPDPGGVDLVTTRTFGVDYQWGLSTVFLHNDKANWGDIIHFETQNDFDYSVGDATSAYSSRLDEYTRSVLFLRGFGDRAYFVVFDKINALSPNYEKKWLLHTVTEPQINGTVTSTEIPAHITTHDGDFFSASNIFNNSLFYGKRLLPRSASVRKVGGEGYRFYVDGSSPVNWGIDWSAVSANKEPFMGGPLEEIGQWRIEISPTTQQQRDLFLNVLYLGDIDDKVADIDYIESSQGNMVGSTIVDKSDNNNIWVALFSSDPEGSSSSDNIVFESPIYPSRILLLGLPSGQTYSFVAPADRNGTEFRFVRGSADVKCPNSLNPDNICSKYSASEQGVLIVRQVEGTIVNLNP